MRHNVIETVIGAVVILIAVIFLGFAYQSAGLRTVSGYTLIANFDRADGLKIGTDVKVSGIKVGVVTAQALDPETFQARVTMMVDGAVKLPDDTAAKVASEGLLGGVYVSLIPGGSDKDLAPGGTIRFTQGPVDLADLIGRFIFSGGGEAAGKPAN
ncbi:MAG: outer membrane lipid asymmetry maintenance protein MlaD [Thalassobaculales bacterium]